MVISTTVTSTTMVSCTRRFWVIHDTLFISASVAIRKSAKTGRLTTRQASHSEAASKSSGTVNCKAGNRVMVAADVGPLAGCGGATLRIVSPLLTFFVTAS